MGQSLFFSIATSLVVEKSSFSTHEIQTQLSKFFDLSLFEYSSSANGKYLQFFLKTEILENHLPDFLEEQFTLMGTIDREREQALVTGLRGKTAEEMLECAELQTLPPAFEFTTDSRISYTHYLFPQWKNPPLYQIVAFSYHSVTKTYMESDFAPVFTMISKMIHSTSKNPLAKTFYIDLQ